MIENKILTARQITRVLARLSTDPDFLDQVVTGIGAKGKDVDFAKQELEKGRLCTTGTFFEAQANDLAERTRPGTMLNNAARLIAQSSFGKATD